mgnify:CR=1 FL=1
MCQLASLAQAASFTARVDRYELQPGESLLLTLELDQPDYFVDPDISPLQQNFKLLSSQHQPLVEDNGQRYSRWLLRLQPRREGNLTIPALRLGELLSAPLRIEVKQRNSSQSVSLEPVYIDSSLDHEELYVQQQAILTVKIHHSVPLFSDGQLSPLNIDGARVLSLGEPVSYQQYIHGIRYGVIEARYAIFPQTTGTLSIAPQTFTATLAGNDAHSLEDPVLSAPGRQIQVKSAEIPLRVAPPPATFPAGAVWLPARNLQLRHSIPDEIDIGLEQALPYSITLELEDQPASALPSMLPQQLPGFRLYPNPAEHSQKKAASGLQVRQHEQLLLVARQTGTLELPALQLPWWDTETDSLQWATTQARKLHVTSLQPAEQAAPVPRLAAPRYLWQAVSLTLALSSLLFAILWRRARRQPAVMPAASTRKAARLQEELRQACKQHQAQHARTLLDQWLRQHDCTHATLSRQYPELLTAMRELNEVLYSPNAATWDGDRLWQALKRVIKQQQQHSSPPLPPLYPT